LEAKDLLYSLYLLSDILYGVRATTAHDINDLKTRVATLEAIAARLLILTRLNGIDNIIYYYYNVLFYIIII